MTLGERIKKRRTELAWTQDILAQKAKISKGFLSDLENNNRGVGAETLLDIATVLGLSLDYLMTGADGDPQMKRTIEIPARLAEFADKVGLTLTKTLLLLEMQRQIVAQRSSAKKLVSDDFNWEKFYDSVKQFF